MLKDRTKFRLLLLLCVIIFTFAAAAGCFEKEKINVKKCDVFV